MNYTLNEAALLITINHVTNKIDQKCETIATILTNIAIIRFPKVIFETSSNNKHSEIVLIVVYMYGLFSRQHISLEDIL